MPAAGSAVLLVEHEERLARFGAGVMRDVMLPAFGVALEITGTDEDLDASQESELVRDMLAVVTFSPEGCTGSAPRRPGR